MMFTNAHVISLTGSTYFAYHKMVYIANISEIVAFLAPLPDVVQAEQPMSATEESEIRQQPTIVHAEQTSELGKSHNCCLQG